MAAIQELIKHYMDRSSRYYEKWVLRLGGVGYSGYRTLEGVLTKPLCHRPWMEGAAPLYSVLDFTLFC